MGNSALKELKKMEDDEKSRLEEEVRKKVLFQKQETKEERRECNLNRLYTALNKFDIETTNKKYQEEIGSVMEFIQHIDNGMSAEDFEIDAFIICLELAYEEAKEQAKRAEQAERDRKELAEFRKTKKFEADEKEMAKILESA
jgi:hypothetical protein